MSNAVHLDEEPGGARHRDDVETLLAEGEATLVFTEPFDLDDKAAAVANHPVAVRTDLPHREAVGLALVVEFHLSADGVAGPRSTTACRGQETGTFNRFFGLIRLHRGGDERDVGRRRGTSGSSGRKDLLVVPPSMTTVVSRSAVRSRASASFRSRPLAMILATIES